MRVHRLAGGVFLAGLLLAGCANTATGTDDGIASAGGTPTAAASASPSANLDDPDRAIKFAQCMRENGIEMEDPVGGRIQMRFKDQDPAKVEAAMEACREHLPNGGEPIQLNEEQQEQARKMAQCMRENGVPNFPDPTGDGLMRLDPRALGVDSETLEKAVQACEQFRVRPNVTRAPA